MATETASPARLEPAVQGGKDSRTGQSWFGGQGGLGGALGGMSGGSQADQEGQRIDPPRGCVNGSRCIWSRSVCQQLSA